MTPEPEPKVEEVIFPPEPEVEEKKAKEEKSNTNVRISIGGLVGILVIFLLIKLNGKKNL